MNENSKIRSIFGQHADKLFNTINQETITYEDFKKLVEAIFDRTPENRPKKNSYTYEWKLHQIYDKHLLFKKGLSKCEKIQKIVKAIYDLINEKNV